MKSKFLSFIVLTFLLLAIPKTAHAVVDPLASPNNLFGIHIHDEGDLEDAAKLVNSNGGDWGYVTFVMRKDDKNRQKWQNTFDKMRRLHLIPIVRIATSQKDGGWEKPNLEDIDSWVEFLDSLNWVIKNRYIIIGNEPNHSKEWGGAVNPEEYSDYLYEFAKKLKSKSDGFFILPAALDVSAPDGDSHMDSVSFLKRALAKHPDLFENVDGFNSHSYPNPNFSGSPRDFGRGSIKSYQWELTLLKNLGVEKKLPVFITETGWAHFVGSLKNGYKSAKTISGYIERAFDIWKTDENIVAVTPFILSYQDPPFDIFSWKDKNGKFYEFYYRTQLLPKTKGNPERVNSLEIKAILTPKIFRKNGAKFGFAYAKNKGQIIWERGVIYEIPEGSVKYLVELSYPKEVEPNHSGIILFSESKPAGNFK